MSVIETASNTVVATVSVGVFPAWLAITPDGAFAYVANAGDMVSCGVGLPAVCGTVSVIATASKSVVATVSEGVGISPVGVAITP